MGTIFAFVKNKKARIKAIGETLNLLTLLVAISKCLVEKISEDKGISAEEAEVFVLNCIKDGTKTIND